jgi:CRISPR-associated protein Cas2
MRWVVAYDVSPDPIRTTLARVLEEVGTRVQESVFEVALEPVELARLEERLAAALGRPEHGQVRFYRLCLDCHRASFGLGDLPADGAEPAIVIG